MALHLKNQCRRQHFSRNVSTLFHPNRYPTVKTSKHWWYVRPSSADEGQHTTFSRNIWGGGQNCINSFLVRVPNLERRTFCKKITAIMFSNSLANTGLVTVGQGWIYSYKLKTSHERSAQMLPILIKRKCYSQQKSK